MLVMFLIPIRRATGLDTLYRRFQVSELCPLRFPPAQAQAEITGSSNSTPAQLNSPRERSERVVFTKRYYSDITMCRFEVLYLLQARSIQC